MALKQPTPSTSFFDRWQRIPMISRKLTAVAKIPANFRGLDQRFIICNLYLYVYIPLSISALFATPNSLPFEPFSGLVFDQEMQQGSKGVGNDEEVPSGTEAVGNEEEVPSGTECVGTDSDLEVKKQNNLEVKKQLGFLYLGESARKETDSVNVSMDDDYVNVWMDSGNMTVGGSNKLDEDDSDAEMKDDYVDLLMVDEKDFAGSTTVSGSCVDHVYFDETYFSLERSEARKNALLLKNDKKLDSTVANILKEMNLANLLPYFDSEDVDVKDLFKLGVEEMKNMGIPKASIKEFYTKIRKLKNRQES